jgi:hypothetical protein
LKLRIRAYRAGKSSAKLLGRAVLIEHDERMRKAGMAIRGITDGLLGKTGKRVDPDRSDRPTAAKPASSE